jgi:hypothetical protein
VLFQSEIRQAMIGFGNRFQIPFTRRQRGQFGEGAYDEIVLAATTLASTKTGALIVIERGVGLKNVIDGGVKLDAELSYDLLVTIFNPTTPLHDGAVIVRRHRVAAAACFLPLTLNSMLERPRHTPPRGHRHHGRFRRGSCRRFGRNRLDFLCARRAHQTRFRCDETTRRYFSSARTSRCAIETRKGKALPEAETEANEAVST